MGNSSKKANPPRPLTEREKGQILRAVENKVRISIQMEDGYELSYDNLTADKIKHIDFVFPFASFDGYSKKANKLRKDFYKICYERGIVNRKAGSISSHIKDAEKEGETWRGSILRFDLFAHKGGLLDDKILGEYIEAVASVAMSENAAGSPNSRGFNIPEEARTLNKSLRRAKGIRYGNYKEEKKLEATEGEFHWTDFTRMSSTKNGKGRKNKDAPGQGTFDFDDGPER